MKLAIARSALLQALASVVRVVERKSTIPVLGNVRLETSSGSLELRATDLDIEVTASAGAAIATRGALTVPAHLLFDVVRKIPDKAEITLEVRTEGQLVVKSGRSRFTMSTLPIEDFPDLGVEKEAVSFWLPSAALARLAAETSFAISTEETRFYLNGIYLHTTPRADEDGGILCAVATDGHRLARTGCGLPAGADDMPGVIVPRKAVAEIARLAQGEGDLQIHVTKTKIAVERGGTRLVSKLIDGTFPDYRRVMPTGNNKVATVKRDALRDAVDRVLAVAADKARAVKLAFSDGRLAVSVSSSDAGEGMDEIDAEGGVDLQIGFNGRYLIEMLDVLTGEDVQVRMDTAESPTVITGENPELTCVLMPLRVY